jgi:hypothetical protein
MIARRIEVLLRVCRDIEQCSVGIGRLTGCL